MNGRTWCCHGALLLCLGGAGLGLAQPVDALDCQAAQRPLPSLFGLQPGYNDPRPPYDWAGAFDSCAITLPSRRTGARLYGVLHFPPGIDRGSRQRPAIVIGPGSGQGVQANYQWLARFLAANGFVALTVDPQGVGYSETTALQGAGHPGLAGIPYQQLENYIDALRSGMDFLESTANPVRRWTRDWGYGLAGHSMSARAASTLQATDSRVDAIVALDNLSSHREGDAGIMSGGGVTGALAGGEVSLAETPNPPRVPALALASDQSPFVDPSNTDPELKKTGYSHWRAAGTTSMVVVFRDSAHSDFARKPGDSIPMHEPAAHYALAWFEWHLRHRAGPPGTLLAARVAGFTRDELLSTTFRSAAFFPGQGVDCPDLLEGSCRAFRSAAVASRAESGNGGDGGGCVLGERGRPDPVLLLLVAIALLARSRPGSSGR